MNYSLKKYYFNNLYCRHTYKFNNLIPIEKEIFGKEIFEIQHMNQKKDILSNIESLRFNSIKFINEEVKYSPIYETYIEKSNQRTF